MINETELMALEKDKARLDWLEQLTDSDMICDLFVNWRSRYRRYPSFQKYSGLRSVIDAFMQESADKLGETDAS